MNSPKKKQISDRLGDILGVCAMLKLFPAKTFGQLARLAALTALNEIECATIQGLLEYLSMAVEDGILHKRDVQHVAVVLAALAGVDAPDSLVKSPDDATLTDKEKEDANGW